MKNCIKLILLLLALMPPMITAANPITREQAQQNALSFLQEKGKSITTTSLRYAHLRTSSTAPESYYVFNIGDNDGYVIAAGDDCAPAILGYADAGYIDVDSMPVNLQSWLEEYAQQIQFMQENGFASFKAPKLASTNTAVSPLMTTTWDQKDPYNQNCPDFFSYGKCVTGCVATAMAQVMYYHRANSVAQTTALIPAYDCRTLWLNGSDTLGHIHVDAIPAGSPIDWNNMLESYSGSSTTAQQQAVANLMKYCGASVEMNYANAWSGGSGAYSTDVPTALKAYFNYSSETVLKNRSDYSSNDAWENLIYNELSNSRPVYYSGRNSSAGHAFVCDGYDGSGYYHINWGWSGTSDGYFLLTALDPDQQGTGGSSSGYNQNQAALINAQPKSSSPTNPVLATSISLNKTSAEINTGGTLQLTATVLPSNATNKAVTWTTSNSSVATVNSNGLVTAKAVGNATITARTTDGSNLSASCSVTVKQSSVLATSISLNKTSAEINTGGTLQLTATVLPSNATNKTVTWTTSNSSVATVNSNGLVTANAVGNATITARTTDGSNLSASCSVTVKQNAILATSVTLNKTSATITKGNAMQLEATVLPSNATNKTIYWTSSNNSIATVNSNGLVNTVSTGNVIITASTTDGSNLSSSCSITVIQNDYYENGEWAILNDGSPAMVGQTTNDHLFVRMDYDDLGTMYTCDNILSFKSGAIQTIWFWLDDDEIYLNDKVQALPPTLIQNDGEPYKEITYNSLQCDLYLPAGIELIKSENDDGDEIDHLQGPRMPNTAIFNFSIGGTKVVDGIEYNVYTILISNQRINGTHFSSKNARSYQNNGALKKDDAPLFGMFIKNNNQNEMQGRLADMIIANQEFGMREPLIAGWDPNDYRFIYGTGGNNESQRFQKYNRVALYGSDGMEIISASGIYLNTTSKVLNQSESFKLIATVTPTDATIKTVTWSSSNNSVATVDNNGNVTALSPGNATITATTTDGSNLSASCSVTVKQSSVLATSISLNKTSAELAKGNTMQLTATVLPSNATNKTVTWTTSNSSVATVSSTGMVTAKSAGNATITATTTDGTNLSASCAVNVVIPVTSISLNKTSAELVQGNTLQLTVTVLPSNATNRAVTWSSSNPTIANVDNNGLVTAIAPGNVTITAMTTDGSNLSASCHITVKAPILTPSPEIIITEGVYAYSFKAVGDGNVTLYREGIEIDNPLIVPRTEIDQIVRLTAVAHVEGQIDGSVSGEYFVPAIEIPEPQSLNSFYVDNLEAFHGETIVIPVQMINEESIMAFQTDIYLPEGFTFITDDDDEPLITPSSRLTNDHIIMADRLSDGWVRVICYTPRSKVISGNEGDLFYITVAVPEEAGGDYSILLRNSLLTTTDYEELNIPDAGASIHVNTYIPGDVNDSRTVNVTDIVITAQYVLQRNPSPFIFEAADMNGDGNITVTDIMLIARLIMTPTANAPKRMPAVTANGDRMSGNSITLTAGETRTVTLSLDNEMDYSAFQLDLNLPEGLTASNFQLTDRAGNHALDVEAISNGRVRVLCYSPAIDAIDGNNGALLTFDVTANGPAAGDIMVDGIEFVTTACHTVLFDAFTIGVDNVTSINEVTSGKTIARVDYFNIAGQRIDRPESGVSLIVTTYTDGTRTTTKIVQ